MGGEKGIDAMDEHIDTHPIAVKGPSRRFKPSKSVWISEAYSHHLVCSMLVKLGRLANSASVSSRRRVDKHKHCHIHHIHHINM